MDPIRHEPETVIGVEVLSFDQVELEKIRDNDSQIFATIGDMKVLYFDYYERFVLQLNNWRYALIPRLPSASSGNEETQNYTLPAYDGVYNLKLAKLFAPAALQNFETILRNTTKFNHYQEPRQEMLVRREEEYISSDATGTIQQRYVSQQIVPVEPSSRSGEASSLRTSNHTDSTNQSERKRDKLKRKFRGFLNKKNSSRVNPNLVEVRDFETLRGTLETVAPIHEFKREEIETTIVSAREIARRLENPKGEAHGEMKEKVAGLLGKVKEGVHDFKERMAARHDAHEESGQKVGIMTMVKDGIHEMKDMWAGKGHEEHAGQPAHSLALHQGNAQSSITSDIDFDTVVVSHKPPHTITTAEHKVEPITFAQSYPTTEVGSHPRERLKIFDNKYLDQPIPAPIIPHTTAIGTDSLYHQEANNILSRPVYSGFSDQRQPNQVYHETLTHEAPIHEAHPHTSITDKIKGFLGTSGSGDTHANTTSAHHTRATTSARSIEQIDHFAPYEKPSAMDKAKNFVGNVGISGTAQNKGATGHNKSIPVTQSQVTRALLPMMLPGFGSSFAQGENGGAKGILTSMLPTGSGKTEEPEIPIQTLSSMPQPAGFMEKVRGSKTIHEDTTPIQHLEMKVVPIPEPAGPSFMERMKASIPIIQEKVETKIPIIKEKFMAMEAKLESKIRGPKRNDMEIQTDPVEYEHDLITSTYIPFDNVVQTETVTQQIVHNAPVSMATQSLPINMTTQSLVHGVDQHVQSNPLRSQVGTSSYEPVHMESRLPVQLQSTSYNGQRSVPEVGRSIIDPTASHVRSGKYAKHLPDSSNVSRVSAGNAISTQKVETVYDKSITHYEA